MILTIIVLLVCIVLFAIGKLRSDIVALCALVVLLLSGILTPEEALSGFSNQVVIMMLGLFVIGGAIVQTGLAKIAGNSIMKVAGSNETVLYLMVMLVTSVIGAFVSNTGTVALMMPIVVGMMAKAKGNPSRLLMPMAFASSMGGMLTLIGTPPNLVIQDVLTKAGHEPLGFFTFTPVGIVCIALGTLLLLPLSKWFLSRKREDDSHRGSGKSLASLIKEYSLGEDLRQYSVGDGSPIIGKSISELDIRQKYGLTILEIRNDPRRQRGLIRNVTQSLVSPDTIIQAGDVLFVNGNPEQAVALAGDFGLKPVEMANKSLAFYDIGIAEIVLMPTSRLNGLDVRASGFREKYNLNILGIRRSSDYIIEDLANMRFKSGDVLLVQGTWNNIGKLNPETDDWVVLGQPMQQASKVILDYKAPLAAVILVAMIASMVLNLVTPVTAVLSAALLMVLTGCLRTVEAAYKTINWESVVLIAAMLPMSVALEKTGASSSVSDALVSSLGGMSPHFLLAGIYFTTSLMTMFISNTATAVLMAPIALASATQLGLSPYPFLFAVTLGASMCFASPFSTPPNALVMKAGQYRFMDYVKVGLPLQIAMGVVMTFVLPLLFPFR